MTFYSLSVKINNQNAREDELTIYFDLDGVLSNFEKWVLSKDHRSFQDPYYLTSALLQNYKEAFAVSELIMGGVELLDQHRKDDIRFLTALPNREPFIHYYPYLLESYKEHGQKKDIDHIFHVFEENKKSWVENVLDYHRSQVIVVNQHRDKLAYCNTGDVLYDDNPYTCKQWNEKGGFAHFVKFSNIEWLDVEGQANDRG